MLKLSYWVQYVFVKSIIILRLFVIFAARPENQLQTVLSYSKHNQVDFFLFVRRNVLQSFLVLLKLNYNHDKSYEGDLKWVPTLILEGAWGRRSREFREISIFTLLNFFGFLNCHVTLGHPAYAPKKSCSIIRHKRITSLSSLSVELVNNHSCNKGS